MAKYRILSIDGGGIRGIVSVVLLQRLVVEASLTGWLDKVDLVAGTSTGGLLALGLAEGLTLASLRDLYVTKGKKIFDDSWLDDVVDLGNVIGADYSTKGLENVLRNILGDTKLADLGKRVLIAAFDLDNVDDPNRQADDPRIWKPKLFHNFPGPNNDRDALAWKVGLYTAAAPTYFPSVDAYVDGGVYANNPSMCALAQSQDARYHTQADLDDVVLLSLGTGLSLQYIKGKKQDWGYGQWAKPLVSLMLDGIAGIAHYEYMQLLGPRYHRLAPVFPEGMTIDMDDVSRVPYMEQFASGVPLAATVTWLQQHWMKPTPKSGKSRELRCSRVGHVH